MKTAFIGVDFQYDFVSGTLAVPDALDALDTFIEAGNAADIVVLTRDWHPVDHCSFEDPPQFKDKSWPSHCVEGTEGAEIHPLIQRMFPEALVFSKGTDQSREAYSGFDAEIPRPLLSYLADHNVDTVWVGGLATDYCVKATAMDARECGYHTAVVADAVRGVHPVTTAMACGEMGEAGIVISTLDNLKTVGF